MTEITTIYNLKARFTLTPTRDPEEERRDNMMLVCDAHGNDHYILYSAGIFSRPQAIDRVVLIGDNALWTVSKDTTLETLLARKAIIVQRKPF